MTDKITYVCPSCKEPLTCVGTDTYENKSVQLYFECGGCSDMLGIQVWVPDESYIPADQMWDKVEEPVT